MYNGLNRKEVLERIQNNQINNKKVRYSRSIKSIVFSNIFTFFNFINICLFILVLITGSYLNGLFIIILVLNTFIAIFQEIKAKVLIEKLTIVTQNKVKVIRDNEEVLIKFNEIVLDDLLVLRSGDSVLVDCKVISSNLFEVDESVITGESNNIMKHKDDLILSGSIITSGSAKAIVVAINDQNYANNLVKEANQVKDNKTYLQMSINRILKVITIFIIPTMFLLFVKQFFFTDLTWQEAILTTVAGVNGMIPGGIVLLTSVSLATGVIKMIRKRVIIQKLNGIETLACVHTLCLDKTGTITDGTLEVVDEVNIKKVDIGNIIKNMLNEEVINATDKALNKHYKLSNKIRIVKKIPFSSSRKYSLVTFDDNSTYVLGALEYIIRDYQKYKKYIEKYLDKGMRVITLAYTNQKTNDKLPKDLKVVGFVILKENLRKKIGETLRYFENEGVCLKIISGDNPKTVSRTLKLAGFSNYEKYLDCSSVENLSEVVFDYDIFGRTTPLQKKEIIASLKESGTVGMIGDGVNDILALKEADCSIAMASGINAARSVSQVVLLDSDFTILPSILKEGRRVVNNVSRVANLYLIKTLYSFIFSILSILFNFPYPFYPVQLSMISSLCVGVPSYLVTLTADNRKVIKNLVSNILRNVIPYGLTVCINIILVVIICSLFKVDYTSYNISMVTITGIISLLLLYNVGKPLKKSLVYSVGICFIIFVFSLSYFNHQLLLVDYDINNVLMIIILLLMDLYIIKYFYLGYQLIISKIKKE